MNLFLEQLKPHPREYVLLGDQPETSGPEAGEQPVPLGGSGGKEPVWTLCAVPSARFNINAEQPVDPVIAGRYQVEALVGSGGMGMVYRARQLSLGGRSVAIKHINPSAFHPDDLVVALETLKNEALVMASLRHPNLAAVYDWVEHDDQVFLVMEYIEGETLQQYVERQTTPLSFEQLVSFASQICSVLNHLHGQMPAILYRDLKPSNLILDSSGRLRLIDFGVARCFSDVEALSRVEGTPGFASPEQLRVISTLPDARSDVYSLGATLYYLATGQVPTDARRRVAEERLPPMSRARHDLPLRFHGLIKRALKLNPDQRFQTVDEFHDTLVLLQFEVNNRETKRLPLYPSLLEEASPAAPIPPTMTATAPEPAVRPTAIDRMKTLLGTAAQTLAQLTARHQVQPADQVPPIKASMQDWLGRPVALSLMSYRDGLLTFGCPTKASLKFPLKVRFHLAGQRQPWERLFHNASQVPGTEPTGWVVDVREMPYEVREALSALLAPSVPLDDRRRQPRLRTRFQVTSPEFYGHKAVATDVSQQGVCVHAPYSLDTGIVTTLTMHFDDEMLEPLSLQARLCWCEQQERGGSHLGFQFVDLTDDDRRVLQHYEQHLTGPVAIRL